MWRRISTSAAFPKQFASFREKEAHFLFFQVEKLKARMSILNSMDEKLAMLAEFNKKIRIFEGLEVLI